MAECVENRVAEFEKLILASLIVVSSCTGLYYYFNTNKSGAADVFFLRDDCTGSS